jgi:RNA polymerase sigma-70 factor (ECF subfamily)
LRARNLRDEVAEVDTTEHLLAQADLGDRSALGRLLTRHRRRLRSFIAFRLDGRLQARVDPSDIVQETLVDAARRLPDFLKTRPFGFFSWLSCLGRQRLADWRRYHLGSSKRSAARELAPGSPVDDCLVDRLAGSGTSPSGQLIRDEERTRIRVAVEALAATDRELLDLRYVDGLSFPEIALRLGIGLGAVKMRHLRAIERARSLLDETPSGEPAE